MYACYSAFRTVACTIQIADTLMQKLPDIFHTYFRREGMLFVCCALGYHICFLLLEGRISIPYLLGSCMCHVFVLLVGVMHRLQGIVDSCNKVRI